MRSGGRTHTSVVKASPSLSIGYHPQSRDYTGGGECSETAHQTWWRILCPRSTDSPIRPHHVRAHTCLTMRLQIV